MNKQEVKDVERRCRKALGGMYLRNAGLTDEQLALLEGIGFFKAPASKEHHLAIEGGLFIHSINVTHRLIRITEAMEIDWSREESPYIVGMLHDLVKTKCYRAVDSLVRDGEKEYVYIQPSYPGHGVASALIAAELGIELNEDERAAIVYHMGLYNVGKEYTDKEINWVLTGFPGQIIATHCADWLAARVDEKETSVKS